MRVADNSGFTLLEIVIALAIMVGAFIGIYGAQTASVHSSTRVRQLNTAAMLAKDKMIEAEVEFQGKSFPEVRPEDSGTFPDPFQEFSWKRSIRELSFPSLPAPGAGQSETGGTNQNEEILGRLVTNFLSQAIREVEVTVSWQRGRGVVEQRVTTWWVDLNHEFKLSE